MINRQKESAVLKLNLVSKHKQSVLFKLKKNIQAHYTLYLLSLPVLAYFVLFHYVPMYGVQIAFKNYIARRGITGSTWIGFEHFIRFFNSHQFSVIIKNTLGISVSQLVFGFPCPIILALLLNEVKNKFFKKSVQFISYAPHFISMVVLVGMLQIFLSPSTGLVNNAIKFFNGTPIAFLSKPDMFRPIYVISGIWQNIGWGSIIYMAALSGIDPQLHEAAIVDGATKFQRILNIDIPGILPTAIILLIMNTGSIMSVGFEKVFLMQNPLNQSASDVISTFVYRSGILSSEFSFAAAVGLFNSVVNFILLISVNQISKKVSSTSLW